MSGRRRRTAAALIIACALSAAVVASCAGYDVAGSPSVSVATGNPPVVPSSTAAAVASTTADTTPLMPPPSIDELLADGMPIVLAHTGGEDQYPASTLFAFEESVAAGVDMLDLNVQLSADGVLVVHHDDTVDRATDGSGSVAGLTVEELSALDNAYWFTESCGVCTDQPEDAYLYRGIRTGERPAPAGYTPDDFAIPSLEAFLERFPQLPLNIEIKGEGEPAIAAADELARMLVEHDLVGSTVVSSFDDSVVAHMHDLLPEVELSPGLEASTAFVLAGTPLPFGMRILQLPPSFEGIEVITPTLMDAVAAAGYVIWVWPNDRALETLDSYSGFLELGVTGLNINFPATGVQAVDEFTG